jgi:thymidylate kinase
MNNKIIILEGPDNTGKDTQQKLIIKNLYKQDGLVFQTHHFSNCPFDNNKDHIAYSKKMYTDMFRTIKEYCNMEISAIFNRSHLGEAVYSPLYRFYDGNYVFDIEQHYKDICDSIYLIVFVGDKNVIFSRDDKLSFYKDANGVQNERELFERAFEKSIISHKCIIDVTGKDIDEVNRIVMKFLTNA